MKATVNTCSSGLIWSSVMKTKGWKNVWLIIPILVFITGPVEKGQSAKPNVTLGERTISFPVDYSMGNLSVRDWGSTETGGWTILGEARGEVTVPAGKELRLNVPSDYSGDFSPLADLRPTDLQELHLEEVHIGDEDLVLSPIDFDCLGCSSGLCLWFCLCGFSIYSEGISNLMVLPLWFFDL